MSTPTRWLASSILTITALAVLATFLAGIASWARHVAANRYVALGSWRNALYDLPRELEPIWLALLLPPVAALVAIGVAWGLWTFVLREIVELRGDRQQKVRDGSALVVAAAVFAGVGTYVNAMYLPRFWEPVSLATDVVIALASLALVVPLRRLPWERLYGSRAPALLARVARVGAVASLVLAVLAPLAVRAVRSSHAADHPNVVWIVIDALRADHLSSYGYHRETSPFLDRLAADSVRFQHAFSQESYTMASVPSFFTSLYPPSHDVLHDIPRMDTLHPRFVTLAEVLREQGFSTVAFVYNPHLKSKYRFDQGFDLYDDNPEGFDRSLPVYERFETARDIESKVRRHLDERSDARPLFLYLHYRDVHSPYTAPPPYDRLFLDSELALRRYNPTPVKQMGLGAYGLEVLKSQYDGSIRYTDTHIERLFETLAKNGITTDNTIVIVTSDHGEEFLEKHPEDRGDIGHGRTLYREQIEVPLIVSLPPSLAGRLGVPRADGLVIPHPVELVDIMPTTLEAIGLPAPNADEFEGHSLVPLLRGERPDWPVYAGGMQGRGSLRAGEWKYYRHRAAGDREYHRIPPEELAALPLIEELYHVGEDPQETRNLIAEHAEIAQQMRAQLDGLEVAFEATPGASAVEIDEATRDQLRALGYVE